jgi:hypothetical protein
MFGWGGHPWLAATDHRLKHIVLCRLSIFLCASRHPSVGKAAPLTLCLFVQAPSPLLESLCGGVVGVDWVVGLRIQGFGGLLWRQLQAFAAKDRESRACVATSLSALRFAEGCLSEAAEYAEMALQSNPHDAQVDRIRGHADRRKATTALKTFSSGFLAFCSGWVFRKSQKIISVDRILAEASTTAWQAQAAAGRE